MKKCNKLYVILAGYRSQSLSVDSQPAPEVFAVEGGAESAAASYGAAILEHNRATVALYEVCFSCPSVTMVHAHNLDKWTAAESMARQGPAGVWHHAAFRAAQSIAPPEWIREAGRKVAAADNA